MRRQLDVRRSPRARWLATGPLALVLLLGLGAPADAEPEKADALRAALRHPLAAHREAAETEILGLGDEGLAIVRGLIADEEASLRRAGWRILAQRPAWTQSVVCRRALGDADGQVGTAAAEALIALAMSDVPGRGVLLPAGCMDNDPAAVRALAFVLADALEHAPAGRVPSVGLRLGEGAVPVLDHIARAGRLHRGTRSLATTVMARVGNTHAREALVALTAPGAMTDRTSLLSALMESPLDAGQVTLMYENLHTAASQVSRGRSWWSPWRSFFRGRAGGWSERGRLRQLVRVHPPTDERASLAEYLFDRLNARRRHPSEIIDLVSSLAALDAIDEETVRVIVSTSFEAAWHPRWRGRAEELGSVMVTLAGVKKHRELIQAEIADLFADREIDGGLEGTITLWETNLPRSVEAWGHYILEADAVRLKQMATELIQGDGEMPTWSARRLGVRLWDRIGTPPAPLVRTLLADGDAWMRRSAYRWLRVLTEAERKAAVEAGGTDEDDGAFLAALALAPGGQPMAVLERLLRLAVEGTRSERSRAFTILARCAAKRPGGDALKTPGRDAALDVRLEAAAALRRVLGLDKVLPEAAGR